MVERSQFRHGWTRPGAVGCGRALGAVSSNAVRCGRIQSDVQLDAVEGSHLQVLGQEACRHVQDCEAGREREGGWNMPVLTVPQTAKVTFNKTISHLGRCNSVCAQISNRKWDSTPFS